MFSPSPLAAPLPASAAEHPLRQALGVDSPLRGTMHECRAPEGTAAHIAFVIALLAGLAEGIPILWASKTASAYPPGLAWLGLDPGRCLFALAADDAECLGTLEVALRGGMAGVAECGALPRLAARRLALAAKTGGSTGFLLRHAPVFTALDSTAFATRWMITPARSPASTSTLGAHRLRAELLYAKGGRTGVFLYEMSEVNHGTAPAALTLVGGGAEAGQLRRTG